MLKSHLNLERTVFKAIPHGEISTTSFEALVTLSARYYNIYSTIVYVCNVIKKLYMPKWCNFD